MISGLQVADGGYDWRVPLIIITLTKMIVIITAVITVRNNKNHYYSYYS